MGIFLQTQIPADGQLLPNSLESFVVLPRATLSECHKLRLTVGVSHVNSDLLPFGWKELKLHGLLLKLFSKVFC